MIFFTKKEIFGIVLILLTIVVVTIVNFQISYSRMRDYQRRADITATYEAILKFYKDFGSYPLSSEDGKIRACIPESLGKKGIGQVLGGRPDVNKLKVIPLLSACEWGESSLDTILYESHEPYLSQLPKDPLFTKGASYKYESNGKHFLLYASFETSGEKEYESKVAKRRISCGTRFCNFGKSDLDPSLDKSITKYQNELSVNNNE